MPSLLAKTNKVGVDGVVDTCDLLTVEQLLRMSIVAELDRDAPIKPFVRLDVCATGAFVEWQRTLSSPELIDVAAKNAFSLKPFICLPSTTFRVAVVAPKVEA